MPLNPKGKKIMSSMQKTYKDPKKAKSVFYASKNAGKIKGQLELDTIAEMREFLGGRIMVPYKEPWMDRVDSVKSMLGWTPTNVTHFRDLGVFGEQILLGVRYGSWAKEIRPEAAANWANYWRPEIQGYVHAYRAATGVDLRQGVEATMPGILLQERLGPTTGALGSGVRSLAR